MNKLKQRLLVQTAGGTLFALLLAAMAAPALAQDQTVPAAPTPSSNETAPLTVTSPRPGLSTRPDATTPDQQVLSGNNPSSPPRVGETPAPVANGFIAAGETPGYLFNLATFGEGPGNTLAKYGVYLHGATQMSTISPISGGHKQVTDYQDLGYYGFDVDLQKAIGIPEALFDVTVSAQFGNTAGSTSSIGSFTFMPYANTPDVRLMNFYYDQGFFDHKIEITLGRMMTGYTGTPYLSPGIHATAWACSFISTSCGTTFAYALNSNKTPYYVGEWAGTITLHPAPHWYLKGGVYENEPIEATTPDHDGFPGRDWSINRANGAIFPVQLGYITSPVDSAYPTNFHIGGYYDSATFPDDVLNAKGLSIALHPGAPLIDQGVYGIYTALQQTVWRFSPDRRSNRGLALFATGDWDVTGIKTMQQQYDFGFILTGPLASRAADTVNFLFETQVIDNREREARDLLALAHNIAGYHMGDQTGFELNYAVALAPGFNFAPYIQYVKNPDQLDLVLPDPKDTHALSLGMRATIRLDVLFGLPQPR
ncbi:carbohydrate porin [Caulobacter sp. S45]|uniref:carbohydrate porin n=1 Tax=Caulobacter sp. S45 TaxID=1641861 RepID=UPI00131B7ED3|nr:carbohydrate porin [Caulobacter sp. S45]